MDDACVFEMKRDYYIYWFQLDGENLYLIFYYDEKDGVLIDEKNRVLVFKGTNSLLQFASVKEITVDVEYPNLVNLDIIANWLESKDENRIDCSTFNNAWNLFADVAFSVNADFDSNKEKTKKIYGKLFWGCNLPSVTPEGKYYEPIWDEVELELMRDVLKSGLDMFRNSIKIIND